jgi:hypothetical protein
MEIGEIITYNIWDELRERRIDVEAEIIDIYPCWLCKHIYETRLSIRYSVEDYEMIEHGINPFDPFIKKINDPCTKQITWRR